jgi:hypothetical protein
MTEVQTEQRQQHNVTFCAVCLIPLVIGAMWMHLREKDHQRWRKFVKP